MTFRHVAVHCFAFSVFGALIAVGSVAQETPRSRPPGPGTENYIKKEVHHELISLPFYTIFDNLAYSVNGTEVTLLGQVTRPVLKDDADKAVKQIEGVESVKNNIEVLPVSPMDDQIRRAAFRAIYGDPALQRYALGAVPPIHIIVKSGHLILEGAVANEMDKNIAGIRANGVPSVFSVTNNLQIAP
jgi:hyperosmotically inducible periplasmic protein